MSAPNPSPKKATTPSSRAPEYPNVYISDHPVLKHKLTHLRSKETSTPVFRQLMRELTFYLGYEITRNLSTTTIPVETPLGKGEGHHLSSRVAIIPVMRAGLGMVDPMLELLPTAQVHHIGIYREAKTLCCVLYYNRLPAKCDSDVAIVLEPLIATGNTLDATLVILKQWGVKHIKVMSVVATHVGLAKLQEAHPDVEVHVGTIDSELNAKGYIIPGVGDVGDRLWGTVQEKPHAAASIVEGASNVAVTAGVLVAAEDTATGAGAGAGAGKDSKKRKK